MKFETLVQETYQKNGSDLHLLPDSVPVYRNADGKLKTLCAEYISRDFTHQVRESLFAQEQKNADEYCADFACQFPAPDGKGFIRVRANIFLTSNGYAIAARLIKDRIPDMESLLIPFSVQKLADAAHGLVLFSAPTGNGKSTSIASILQAINETQAKRIVTIEDPIEYVFFNRNSLISQRQTGLHCRSFSDGLKSALREDPDIIMVGEIRDKDTVHTAISAAESGHLVFSTLHASTVEDAVDRILQYYGESEKQLARAQLANAFRAIVVQKLLPKRHGGRVAAFEVLHRSTATANVIRTGAMHTIRNYMLKKDGMQGMEEAISSLRLRGFVD